MRKTAPRDTCAPNRPAAPGAQWGHAQRRPPRPPPTPPPAPLPPGRRDGHPPPPPSPRRPSPCLIRTCPRVCPGAVLNRRPHSESPRGLHDLPTPTSSTGTRAAQGDPRLVAELPARGRSRARTSSAIRPAQSTDGTSTRPRGGVRRPGRDADDPHGRGRRRRGARAPCRGASSSSSPGPRCSSELARAGRAAPLHRRSPAGAGRGDLPRSGLTGRATRRRSRRAGIAVHDRREHLSEGTTTVGRSRPRGGTATRRAARRRACRPRPATM